MNALAAPPEDPRARGGDVRENTLRSFNAAAAAAGVAYVEFDVQVRDRDHSVSHPHLGLARRGRQRPPLTTPVFFIQTNGGFGLVCPRRTDRGDGAPRVLVLGEPGCCHVCGWLAPVHAAGPGLTGPV